MPFEDLLWTQGKDNMGGLNGYIYFCPTEDIDTALLPTIGTDNISLTGDFACKSTKKFIQIYFTKSTGKLDDTGVGERDGKSRENLLEFFFPGSERKVESFKQMIQNTPGIWIYEDAEGNQRVVGVSIIGGELSLGFPAYAEAINGTSGAASADRKGTTFQVKAESPHAPLFYEGTIPLTEAV